jgi:prephenate dehydratase
MPATVIGYEGPPGTSDQRAVSLVRTVPSVEALPLASVDEVLYTVDKTPKLLGIIPVETSTDGELTTVLDQLIFNTSTVYIREEVVLIESIQGFCLGDLSEIDTVVSHPDVLKLSKRFINENRLQVRQAASTTLACEAVLAEHNPSLLALAPEAVGLSSGLRKTRQSVTDVPDIRTRYFLIGHDVADPTGHDRTSLVVIPSVDRAGTLAELSNCFAENNVNMFSIMSRPLQARLGVHAFFITCEGHAVDEPMVDLFQKLLVDLGATLKLLGSYPTWIGEEVTAPYAAIPPGSVDRDSHQTLVDRQIPRGVGMI